jgi:hypothetical protein
VGTAYSVTLTGAGGVSPYTFSVTQGTLPSGLSLNTTTGVISGTPTAAGASTFTVTLKDSGSPTALSATQSFSIAIAAPPAITFTTTTLPAATFGTAYTASVSATGGVGGLTYSVGSGILPTWATLNTATGAITGTPNSAGTSTFAIRATDAYGDSGISASLSIVSSYPTLSITTAGTLPAGTFGTAYSQTLAATGGSGTGYSWTVVSGTGLSAVGLSLSGAGVISGTPSAVESAGSVTVKVTDSASNTATATLSLTVSYSTLTITTASLPNGAVGAAYSQTLAASGGSGTGFSWSVTSGSSSLSAVGLSVSGAGVVAANSPTAGTASFTVQVKDSASNTATASFSVTFSASLTITTTSVPTGYAGVAYSQTLAASGGSGTGYTWSISSGSLSSVGLTLSAAGVLSGSSPTAGTATFTAKVTDSANNTATQALTVTINAGLNITTTNLPSATLNIAYSQTLTAAGGSGSGYTWSVTSGSSSLSAVQLSVSSGGVISGTPTATGTATFTVQVKDSANNTTSANLTIAVNASLTVTTTSLPNATEGTAYSATLVASGGTGTGYTWSVTSGSGLSAVGLSLSSAGVISGTPTATESATQFVVKVTDSGGNTANATLALIVNYPTLGISTTNLPGAVVNTAYSETFQASGGSGHYSWSVITNLAGLTGDGLTFTTVGVLSGTPTTAEQIPFTVQVTDTSTNNTSSAPYTLIVNSAVAAQCTHNGSGNALLHGSYAFILTGFDPNGNFYDQIGNFTADGAGNISAGNGDANSTASSFSTEQQYTFTGTYSIGSTDNRGIMNVTNTNTGNTGLPSSSVFCFVADGVSSGVATSGRIIEADGSGYIQTGSFQAQSSTSYSAATLSGGYAFGVQGANDGNTPASRSNIVGQITFNGSGGVSGGQVDTASYSPTAASTTYHSAVSILSSGSSYTVASGGRGTMTLNVNGQSVPMIFYVVGSGSKLMLLSQSSTGSLPLFAGEADQQTVTSFTTTNAAGSGIFYAVGATYLGGTGSSTIYGDKGQVGQLTFSSSGTATFLVDVNSAGTVTTASGFSSASYTVSSLGYVQLPGAGSQQPNFYLYAPGAGFGLDSSNSANFFVLSPQTGAGAYTTSSVSGNFGIGTVYPAAYNPTGTDTTSGDQYPGVFSASANFNSSGTVSLVEDQIIAPGLAAELTVGQTTTNAWALDSTYGASTGRFTVSKNGNLNVVGYIVSPTKAIIMQAATGQDGEVEVAVHQ